MCIGIPMQVLESLGTHARCAAPDGGCIEIDTLLVGDQPAGTWLLTFLDTAREVITAQHARDILQALQALQAAVRGEGFDHLIADLVDREPQLPDFLREPAMPAKNPS